MSTQHPFDWWRARLDVADAPDMYVCPVHGGGSLHVEQKGGKVLAKCFGCDASYEDILAALADVEAVPSSIALKSKAPQRTRASRPDRPAYSPTGELVGKQVWNGSGWRWQPRGVSPRHLHGGLASLAGVPDPVVLTEGHGPAIALNAAGIPAVATVTGKSSAPDDVGVAYLYGRTVILSPDKGGERHMERTGAVVSRVAASVLIAPSWPDAFPDNGDAADYIAAYGVKAMQDFYAGATPWSRAVLLAQPVSGLDRLTPEPLVDDFAHPTAHTGIWGPSGAGKGVMAAWKISARTRAGESVLLLDYEGHAAEWRSRLEDFGADLDRVYIALPLGLDGGLLTGAIWDQKDEIKAAADALGVDWVYVDSVTAACGVADITSATAPGPYFAALNHIGRPSVSVGHVTKTEHLQYPFGSMAWRAFIRMGWSFAGTGDERDLINRKTNDYPTQDSVKYDWAWTRTLPPQKVPSTLTVSGVLTLTVADRAEAALGSDTIGLDELHARVEADGLGPVKIKTLSGILSRSPRFDGRGGSWRRRAANVPLKSGGG